MKHFKKILSLLLAAVMLAVTPGFDLCTETVQAGGVDVITGFADFDVEAHTLTYSVYEKPALGDIVQQMPQQLEVYLNGSSESVFIDVSWYEITGEYESEGENCYYYQFSPTWDQSKYVLSDSINLLENGPYIAVYLQEYNPRTRAITTSSYEGPIYNYLRKLGYNVAATCGIMANIQSESAFAPNNLQNTYEKSLEMDDVTYTAAVNDGTYTKEQFVHDSAGYGLVQWTYQSRKQGLYEYAVKYAETHEIDFDISNCEMQLEYLQTELKANSTTYSTLTSTANTAQGAYNAGYVFCYYFERPAKLESGSITRGNLAKKYWNDYGKNIQTTSSVTVTGHSVPTSLTVGDTFTVKGTVKSTSETLTSVTVSCVDMSGNVKTTSTAKPNSTSYNLSGLDDYIKFDKLTAGNYYYKITATTKSGKTTVLENAIFQVLEPVVEEKVDTKYADISSGVYTISAKSNSNYVLDIAGASTKNGGNLQLYASNGTNAQKFFIKSYGSYYTIMNLNSGKMLDVANAGKTAGTNVWQYTSNGTDAQKWKIAVNDDGSYTFISVLNGLALDVKNGKIASDTNIQVNTVSAGNAQKFVLKSAAVNITSGNYYIQSKANTNYVLDIAGASASDGANLQLYALNYTKAQRYYIESKNGYCTIKNLSSGKMLDVAGAGMSAGTNVWQYTKNGTDAQKWQLIKNSDGSYTFVSALNGLVLDVYGGRITSGTNVWVYTANGSNAQKFVLNRASEDITGYYYIQSKSNTNYVFDIYGGSKSDGGNLQLYASNGTGAQQFYIESKNGYATIKNVNSGKYLDVSGAGKTAGTNVWQYTGNGTNAQKWRILKNSDESYTFISVLNGLALDVASGNISSGSNIQVYTSNGTNAQKFVLKKAK